MFVVLYVFVAASVAICFQLLLTRLQRSLSSIPGPILASFSNLWKVAAVYNDDMPGWNMKAHDEYGPVVRIGPNHVSFSSPEAFQVIYNSRKFPKTEFYEVGAPVYKGEPLENLFSLRDVHRHHVLRKNIGHLYTKTAVKDLEPHIESCVDLFVREIADQTKNGPVKRNMSRWLHYYAYECLSEVNVSKKLGFIERGGDVKNLIGAADQIFFLVGIFTQAPALHWLLGFLRSLKPAEEAEPVLRYTIDEVEARKKDPAQYQDMLSKFLRINEQTPEKLSVRDIIAAVFINLTAGHDVLAITLRAIWYHLARNPRVLTKLREEINEASKDYSSSQILPFSIISQLPYLNAVIQEVLRVHPNTGTIIERVTPKEGATIDGYTVGGGTVVGMNAWVLHRNKEIYGEDADVFRPERWIEATEQQKIEMNKYILSFGAGAHSCVGRHMAMIMISKVVVEFYRRFDASLPGSGPGWKIRGGWVTKQEDLELVLSRLES